jgi:hypothetical protein
LELSQKENLFYLKLSMAMPSLIIFGQQMGDVLHFQTWSIWVKLENHLELERELTRLGPVNNVPAGPCQQCCPARLFAVRPTRPFPPRANVQRSRAPESLSDRAGGRSD